MKRHGVFLLLLEQDASLSQTSLSLSCQSSLARAERGGERTKRETPALPLPQQIFLIIIMQDKFWLLFQFEGIVFICVLVIGAGFGHIMGWFPSLMDIIGVTLTALIFLLMIQLLYQLRNNKMERTTEDFESSETNFRCLFNEILL